MSDMRFHFDIAARNDLGTRPNQEDCVAVRFSNEAQAGLAVLADGMGGHDDGGIASKFLVTGVAGELIRVLDKFSEWAPKIPERLEELTQFANIQLRHSLARRNLQKTMGATLVSTAVVSDQLYWASVGDSPLYLFRNRELKRLNADHSMAAQIDFMVEAGMISAEKAKEHPDRNVLTSAIRGKDIPKIDCPGSGLLLQPDDILVLASDGLNMLGSKGITEILTDHAAESCEVIADALINAVRQNTAKQKDNTAFAIVKMMPLE